MCLRLLLILSLFAVQLNAQNVDSVGSAIHDSLPIPSELPVDDLTQSASAPKSEYIIQGVVRDGDNGEGIPFATIHFAGSGIGVAADSDGNFLLKVATLPSDTVYFGAIGYATVKRTLKRSVYNHGLFIELTRSELALKDFVFNGGEDPAVTLIKNIIARKPFNNPDKVENYRYESYNKMEVDLERLSRQQFERLPIPMIKKLSFIYDNLDTTSEATPFLPFYLTETISDFYYQRSPARKKEFIHASLFKGIRNESVTKFLGSMYLDVNVYNNFLPVFEKNFVSPISSQGLFYYKYKIKDTQQIYGRNVILVQFRPKRVGESCFTGDFWVVDSVFAIQRISMQVPKDANINWVQRVNLYQEFSPVQDSFWFCTKEKFIAAFTAPYLKLPGFIGRKTTSYKNISINDDTVATVLYDKRIKGDLIVDDTARQAGLAYWSQARHDSLSKSEKAIYKMIDTLESMPLFTSYKNTIKFFATGVKEFGAFELGPYWYAYSSNPYEGARFRLSGGTTPKLFKDVYLNGYLAYGTKDDSFKYGLRGLWILQRQPRMFIYASYTQDLDRSTSYYDNVSNDNIFANFVRKTGVPWKLAFVTERRFEFYKTYYSGFSHLVTVLSKDFHPYKPLPSTGIFGGDNGASSDMVRHSEVSVRLRYAYKERLLEGNYLITSLGSRYPIVEVKLAIGLRNFLRGQYDYRRLTMSVSDRVKIPPLGELYVNLYAGRFFGTLPYPLLEIHPGNEFHYYNRHAFNMMNRFEFISDRYAGINVEHSIGSGFFNYIPLLKRAKLRQFWTAKAVIGDLSAENRALNLDKGYTFRTLRGDPYIELGTGVANIFQLFRLDLVWRVSPTMLPTESADRYFTIFGSVNFRF